MHSSLAFRLFSRSGSLLKREATPDSCRKLIPFSWSVPRGNVRATGYPGRSRSTFSSLEDANPDQPGASSSRTSTTSSAGSPTPPPFYGSPRPPPSRDLSPLGRLGVAVQSAATALADPTRAEAVAALGEVTGHVALRGMYDRMMRDPTGQRILRDMPTVDGASIDLDSLLVRSSGGGDGDGDDDGGGGVETFGGAYAKFMQHHGFDPDERSEVKFVDDPELAYVMLRHRQIHDFLHVLFKLPPNVLGELALKWVELVQTNLPVALLSVTFGPLQLTAEERRALRTVYLPWALRVGGEAKFLMNVYYEEEFGRDLDDLRSMLGVDPAPRWEDATSGS